MLHLSVVLPMITASALLYVKDEKFTLTLARTDYKIKLMMINVATE